MRAASARGRLMLVDAVVNLLLGAILLLAPLGSLRLFGVPTPSSYLFSAILGGVLIGIGGALLASARGLDGLGLVGAIVINACGAIAVIAWLATSDAPLGRRGGVTLWVIAVLVLAIAAAEAASRPWRGD